MNKWLFSNGEIFNLKRANRIYMCYGNRCWKLVAQFGNEVDSDDESAVLSLGSDIKVEEKLEVIKDFLKSSESYLEME